MKAKFSLSKNSINAKYSMPSNRLSASFSIGGREATNDYLLLYNKPLINGIELIEDKTSLELGLASLEQGLLAQTALQPNDNISELVNNVGYITGITSSDIQTALGYIPYSAENPSGFITISALSGYATENWVGQQGYLTSSDLSGYATEQWVNNQGFIKGISNTDVINALGYTPYDNSNPAGYITSESLPTVNNSTITIQKNGSDIESFNLNQPTNETINITVPTQTSDLRNNSGFITNAVNNLANYYLKSETYTKTEVQQLIASIPQFSVVVVQTLPVTGERMVLYLVPKEGASPDVYNEYIWVETDADFELIGNTAIDLTDYVKFTDLATVATTGDYDDLINQPTIPTATSELTNDSGFITSTALTPYALISSLSTVATSGSYTDLSDKPTIGNGTITFTQGGVTKGTITTNQSGDTTIDFDAGSTVDQTFDGTSTNAQSGVAIKNAKFLRNTATGSNSLTIDGITTDTTNSINIGAQSTVNNNSVALGYYATASGLKSVALGLTANAFAKNSIQIGSGANSTENTLQVRSYTLLDTSTGLIPDERISSNIARTSSIGNGTITFTQGGVTKGTFTLNQTGNTTIDFDAGGGGTDVQAYTATEVETLWESI